MFRRLYFCARHQALNITRIDAEIESNFRGDSGESLCRLVERLFFLAEGKSGDMLSKLWLTVKARAWYSSHSDFLCEPHCELDSPEIADTRKVREYIVGALGRIELESRLIERVYHEVSPLAILQGHLVV